jgi:hypothetical protein
MKEFKNIIIVLDDGETYSTGATILKVSDEAMELLKEGVPFKWLDDEVSTTESWGEVVQEVGYCV